MPTGPREGMKEWEQWCEIATLLIMAMVVALLVSGFAMAWIQTIVPGGGSLTPAEYQQGEP